MDNWMTARFLAPLALRETATNWPVTHWPPDPASAATVVTSGSSPVAARNPNNRISRKMSFVTIVRNAPLATRIWHPPEYAVDSRSPIRRGKPDSGDPGFHGIRDSSEVRLNFVSQVANSVFRRYVRSLAHPSPHKG